MPGRLADAVRQEIDIARAMWQLLFQLPLHRPPVNHEGIDDVFMTCRETVVIVAVAVENLNYGASAIERRSHGELQQIVGNEQAFARGDGGTQTAKHGVEVLDRRLELEACLIIRVETSREWRIHPKRVVRQDGRIAESVRASMPEDPFNNVQ